MKRFNEFVKWGQAIAESQAFRYVVFVLFILQAGFLAIATKLRTPPDEGNQIDFIKYYADHSLSPIIHHQTPTLNLGDITREVDFVYHYVMSLVMRVLPFSQHVDLYFIRFFSIGFAVLTFILLLKIFRDLHVSKAGGNLGLLVLTNLPMVLMMSSAVNADVLVWLGTVAGIYSMMRIWKKHQPIDLLMLFTIAIYGGIIKRTLFPVCLVFGVAGIVMAVKYRRLLIKKINFHDWKLLLVSLLLVLGVGLFAERVGGNIYHYHTISPSCTQVQGDAACSVFWLHDREAAFENNKEAAKSVYLGQGASIDETLKSPVLFAVSWGVSSFDNLVDIQTQGWHHEVAPPWLLGVVLMILAFVTTIGGIVYELRRFKDNNLARWRLVIIGFALLGVGSQLIVNYQTYMRSHVFGLALNGRYILPSMILLSGLCVWYGQKMFGKKIGSVIMVAMILGIVTLSGLIMMVRNPQLFHG